ncbi:hypothetical protein WR25_07760 [Diploscapter pachys]|uniref:Nuclear speckle splicing regulatory protein 1 N-terminal domain-containing protein n=1 Tax=Diploscapter pachys TaxID=2018661 RepID=A0A2A2LA03_9BILA|nr:hypothetical protein WR25_07760 [Diploscapter pachys]
MSDSEDVKPDVKPDLRKKMEDEAKKKKYGLVISMKKPSAPQLPAVRPIAAIFADDDDDGDTVDVMGKTESASTIRTQKQAERLHERAMAEDPTIFDYDKNYDEIQAVKNEKIAVQKEADKERKAKYVDNMLKASKMRKINEQSVQERQQQKEREKEGDEFADKEVFITSAYKEQLEAIEKLREEEEYEAKFNSLTSVEKQKMWQAGFQRQMLESLARTGQGSSKTAEEQAQDSKKKVRHIRERIKSRSPSPIKEMMGSKKESKEKLKKSIYSDDEDGNEPKFEPPQKNFEGELKPGLNVARRARTHHEKVMARFTPSPEGSDDEQDRRTNKEDRRREERRRDRHDSKGDDRREGRGRRRHDSEEASKEEIPKEVDEVKPDVKDFKAKLKLGNRIDKEARLKGLKEILKQRNTAESIEAAKQRYLERKQQGIPGLPL